MNIVFDFGAVLFTWKPAQLLARHFPQRAADPQTAAALAHAVFGHTDWHRFDGGTLTMSEIVKRTALRLALDINELTELVAAIADHLTPIADTRNVLEQLCRKRSQDGTLRLYYLSNMPVPFARELERRHDFVQWFDGGVFSGDVRIIKPDQAIYRLLQARYAMDSTEIVFIDDLKANVAAAQALGWHGIHFESPQQLHAELVSMDIIAKTL